MNKYKFSEGLSDKTKSVEKDFLIDEKVNELMDILESMNEIHVILLSNDVNLIKSNSIEEINNGIEITNDLEKYFTYPQAFEDKQIEDFGVQIMEVIKDINSTEFATKIMDIKKSHSVKNFDITSAMKYGDKLSKLNSDLEKLKEKLKGIILNIKIIEDEFVDDFNRLVVDINEKKITAKQSFEDLFEEYSKPVVIEYKIQSVLSMINNLFNGIDKNDIIIAIENNRNLQSILGDEFFEIVKRLKNVGANI